MIQNETIVRARAYEIWEAEGRPVGRDAEHWFMALQEFTASPSMTTPTPEPAPKKAKKAEKEKAETVVDIATASVKKKAAKKPA